MNEESMQKFIKFLSERKDKTPKCIVQMANKIVAGNIITNEDLIRLENNLTAEDPILTAARKGSGGLAETIDEATV